MIICPWVQGFLNPAETVFPLSCFLLRGEGSLGPALKVLFAVLSAGRSRDMSVVVLLGRGEVRKTKEISAVHILHPAVIDRIISDVFLNSFLLRWAKRGVFS